MPTPEASSLFKFSLSARVAHAFGLVAGGEGCGRVAVVSLPQVACGLCEVGASREILRT